MAVSDDVSSFDESAVRNTRPEIIDIPQFVEPRVDLLMLAYRRPSLPDAIAALVRNTHRVEYSVSIMLNGTTEDVATAVRDRISGAQLDESPVNLGFSAGMNRLAEKARGDYIVMLNDDTEVHAGWLDRLVQCADEMPDVGMVTSRLIFPDGRLQEAGARLSVGGIGVQVGWGQPDDDESLWVRREVDYGSAAALLIRREAFERVGGFDEAFFPAYYEDVDLALRVRAAGWKVLYEPDAVATHHQWGSTTAGERSYSMTYNRRTFVQRWGHLFTDTAVHTNELPDAPVVIPDDSVVSVPRRPGHSPWEFYAQWLVEQLVEMESRAVLAVHEVAQVRAELSAAMQAHRALLSAALERAEAAESLAAIEKARADHHQAARAEIEALWMWKIRRSASRLLRSSEALAGRMDDWRRRATS